MQDEAYPPEVVERFWAKVDKNGPIPQCRPDLGPCWLWTLSTNSHGYGQFKARSREVPIEAHAFAWDLDSPKPAKGMHRDHLCRTPACVRRSHLEAVTNAVNQQRGSNRRLSVADVYWLRYSTESYGQLGRRFGINKGTAANVATRRSWRELAEPWPATGPIGGVRPAAPRRPGRRITPSTGRPRVCSGGLTSSDAEGVGSVDDAGLL